MHFSVLSREPAKPVVPPDLRTATHTEQPGLGHTIPALSTHHHDQKAGFSHFYPGNGENELQQAPAEDNSLMRM